MAIFRGAVIWDDDLLVRLGCKSLTERDCTLASRFDYFRWIIARGKVRYNNAAIFFLKVTYNL